MHIYKYPFKLLFCLIEKCYESLLPKKSEFVIRELIKNKTRLTKKYKEIK